MSIFGYIQFSLYLKSPLRIVRDAKSPFLCLICSKGLTFRHTQKLNHPSIICATNATNRCRG